MWARLVNKSLQNQADTRLRQAWLKLLGLTWLSFLVAESGHLTPLVLVLVLGVTVVKGRWVIDEFMGLKQSLGTRWIVSLYFYLMTAVIGLGMLWSPV